MKEMVRIGTLVAQVVATAGGERATLEEGRVIAGTTVTATTAITVRKQNELNLSAGRSLVTRDIASLGAGVLSGDKRGHSRPKSSDLTGRKRPGRTD